MAQERLAQLLQVLAGMQAENPPLPPSPDLTGQMGEPAPRLPMGTGVTAGSSECTAETEWYGDHPSISCDADEGAISQLHGNHPTTR
jgi:hypothetical protein